MNWDDVKIEFFTEGTMKGISLGMSPQQVQDVHSAVWLMSYSKRRIVILKDDLLEVHFSRSEQIAWLLYFDLEMEVKKPSLKELCLHIGASEDFFVTSSNEEGVYRGGKCRVRVTDGEVRSLSIE